MTHRWLAQIIWPLAFVVARCQRVVVGDAAAATFAYQGKPIHPACVWFSREGSSRGRPIALATCSAASAAPATKDGWTFADKLAWPGEAESSGNGYSGYRVLARKGARYLLALESSGGGTGKFSDLSWVRLGSTDVRDDRRRSVWRRTLALRCFRQVHRRFRVDRRWWSAATDACRDPEHDPRFVEIRLLGLRRLREL